MNHTILEMACAFKIESRRFRLKNSQKERRITDDVIFVSVVTDLYKSHSDECEEMLEKILNMVRFVGLCLDLAMIRIRFRIALKIMLG